MKILLVDPSLYTPPYDGALAGALAARGHEVLLAGRPRRPSDPPFGGEVRLVPTFYRRGESLRAWGPLVRVAKGLEHAAGLAELRRLVARERPDVVHWQWPSLPLLDAATVRSLSSRVPQVVTVHDARVFKSKQGLRRLMSVGWGSFVRAADAVIVHVRSTRAALANYRVVDGRVSVVPHPVFPAARPVTGTRERTGSLRVLLFGRLSRDKGVDVFATALERLREDVRPRLRITVCGPAIAEDRGVRAALSRLRRHPGIDLRVGYVPEATLEARLAATDIVVLPHREVDASGVLMKALGHDVALVASDVPGFWEVLEPSGAAAFFRAGDPNSLAGVLDGLARNPARVTALAAAAAQLREGALAWPHAAELTEAVYERCRRPARRVVLGGAEGGTA